ncbi:MAG: hypothetical protein AAFU70_02860 [Planctomycetota bacterium]
MHRLDATIAVLLGATGLAAAQSTGGTTAPGGGLVMPTGGGEGPGVYFMPTEAELEEIRRLGLERREIERELARLKREYFSTRVREVRELGLVRLRELISEPVYAELSDTFRTAGEDVRATIHDELAITNTHESIATLAWDTIFARAPEWRAGSLERLAVALDADDTHRATVHDVLRVGLGDRDPILVERAGLAAERLRAYEVVPSMIAAQVATPGPNSNAARRQRTGDLAFIFVGTQTAFVSDQEPVVSDSAVAFDPELSVVSEGVTLVVHDAVAFEYRMGLHYTLTRMTTEATGEPTKALGFELDKWRAWHEETFEPWLASRRLSSSSR